MTLAWAGALGAQDAAQDEPLNLPANVSILEHKDPSVRKATAIVNGTVLTDTDVDQRLALVLAANKGEPSAEERKQLRLQVLSNLIDETLEIQEAAANKITIDKSEIQQTFDRVAGQFKQAPGGFIGYLKSKGTSEASMKRQIEGELAWRRLLGREVEPFVNVSDDEVNQVIARLKASKGTAEYHVAEIYLSATPINQAQVLAKANDLVDKIRRGSSFVAYAHEFSEASTKAVGGDLGWVRAEQLPDQIAATMQQMPTNAVSDPIPVNGGFSIIALIDKRAVLTADPRDAQLSLKQMTITLPPGSTRESAEPKLRMFSDALKTLKGCGDAEAVGLKVGAEVVANDQLKVRDLPPQLQQVVLDMQVGEATPPFGSMTEGIRALVLCGRDAPEAVDLPNFEQIQSQMQDERVNLRARRYLRDLRRDAVIEYR
ncbi:peptidyl-prolyl cis-trans isomerase SurA [Sphingomonas vulcanisoli]|uniref:Parvulin-like PPIase n=1 Tax=Sphingomonas vulcanisoli TaxID=1658060 RepID=A0ABX0TNG4_9SPHN|nr:peptidylprolyl isomerase [Sphingomonas vulcanisoli]NIJ07051.1 peptidyl-prolyl cis-trans isomerase SurA [Sphingomonas vulcanisoli]